MTEYSQGICQDGAAILKDGKMMTIEEILEALRYHDLLVDHLRNAVDVLYGEGGTFRVSESEALLAELSAHNGGEG